MRAYSSPVRSSCEMADSAAAFIVHLMHQLAAFFAWIWMFVHMIGTLPQAGLQATKIWEIKVLDDIWTQGLHYFSSAGGGSQKILAVAVIPLFS